MRGLIYGDVRGSVYEWKPVEEQDSIKATPHFTDDTVLGAAVADALITCQEQDITDDEDVIRLVKEKLREYGLRHPDAGYSRSFQAWLKSDDPKPYGSKTNGALMRCTAAGWLAHSSEEAARLGRLTAMPTHDHPEAMDAAALAAEIIYRLRTGETAEAMYHLVNERYPVPRLEDIRPITEFDFSCKTTLPIAFAAFYEAVCLISLQQLSNAYPVVSKAVENAISLGGDTDTNAAIAAAFAEAWRVSQTFGAEKTAGGKSAWYTDKACEQWALPEVCCTPDIQEVIRRMDEAVAQF